MNIQHNGTINIAVGRSRKEANWRNKEFEWSEFLEKISVTHRTPETVAEYITAKKTRQDELKDVGGFVGGYLNRGKRVKGSVLHRQLVTLDLDFASPDLWEDLTLLYGCAMAMYSTHKHTPAAPRLRLIIPLDREVAPDEYMAISRRIAGDIGIELFDPTTFQAERLMYWPSTSKDGVYEFQYQDGPWISADDILAKYVDWKDVSAWPISEKVDRLIQRDISKQGDPLEKPGVVGAFCRTFDIDQAIEKFLPEVYIATDVPDRYSYAHGSTACGLITYDSKFAFSHHGTDPAGQKLCNAFDLVRIHLFGLQDEEAKADLPINKLPSYNAMCEFASKDKNVRIQLTTDKLADVEADFGEGVILADGMQIGEDGELEIAPEPNEDKEVVEVDKDWMGKVSMDKKGNIHSTIDNVVVILQNDPRFKGKLGFNDFDKTECALGSLPWRKIPKGRYEPLSDLDDSGIRHYLEKVYNISGQAKIDDAIRLVLRKNKFNPVKDYLAPLEWDGTKRLDTLLIDYLGAEDNMYTRAVTRKALVAAVARIFRPGVKFDCVLTLIGKQGIGKSQIIKKLGKFWSSDSFSGIGTKDAYEQIQGVWLVEIAELAGLKKAEVDMIKHFISKTEDRFRVAYGRKTETFVRQCIFFATTNDFDGFLKDTTGNRRWWPVVTGKIETIKDIFIDLTDSEISQIWAEAKDYYQKGESLYLHGAVQKLAEKVQAESTEIDDRIGIIEDYLDMKVPANWVEMDYSERRFFISEHRKGEANPGKDAYVRDAICAGEIYVECMDGRRSEMTAYNTKYIHTAMRIIPGWERTDKLTFGVFGRQRGYQRTEL